jgi:hypothetical protein
MSMLMDSGQVESVNEQISQLGPGEPYLVALVDGQVFVRSTNGLPRTLVELWRRNPAMMAPDSAGRRPETREVNPSDL